MTPHAVQLTEIVYDPEFTGFQARATIFEGDVAYVYPVHVPAALTAEYGYVAARLTERARAMHTRCNGNLHMRRDSSASQSAIHLRAA